MRVIVVVFAFVVLLSNSCNKKDKAPIVPPVVPEPTLQDTLPFAVYIGGFSKTDAGNYEGFYLINDSLVKVPKFVNVKSIQVSGKDIYLAGGEPYYLKNDSAVYIQGAASILGLFVEGKNVYAWGMDSNYMNRYWINGEKKDLEGINAHSGVFDEGQIRVYKGDVYICGSSGPSGAVWKNGKLTLYPVSGIVSIDFRKDTIYAGQVGKPGVGYFRNTEEILLNSSIATAGNYLGITDSSINIVYRDGTGRAFVNSNGNTTELPNINYFGMTTYNNDFYVAGDEINTSSILLWKNGNMKRLSHSGAPSCVYVK